MTGLETRGYRPKPHERGELARYVYERLSYDIRRRVSIEIIHGNSWSGWLENGNPHGDPRPGPVAVLQGIVSIFPAGSWRHA